MKNKLTFKNFERLINKFLGTYYWYQITIFYKDKNNVEILNFVRDIGVRNKSMIMDSREIMKTFPLHKQKGIPKKLLKNGIVYFSINSYLGCFKNEKI